MYNLLVWVLHPYNTPQEAFIFVLFLRMWDKLNKISQASRANLISFLKQDQLTINQTLVVLFFGMTQLVYLGHSDIGLKSYVF